MTSARIDTQWSSGRNGSSRSRDASQKGTQGRYASGSVSVYVSDTTTLFLTFIVLQVAVSVQVESSRTSRCSSHAHRFCPSSKLANAKRAVSKSRLSKDKHPARLGTVLPDMLAVTDDNDSHPLPFKCSIRPRSVKAATLIRDVHE